MTKQAAWDTSKRQARGGLAGLKRHVRRWRASTWRIWILFSPA